jgi:DNA repair photolyase
VSITSLDDELIGNMEPRTSRPARRLQAIRELTEAGIPVAVFVAPVIPGLTDEEMPQILEAAADAGAVGARYMVVRLPLAVEEIFVRWLRTHYPDRENRVLSRIRSMRGGNLSDSRFGVRMRGEGEWAGVLNRLFHMSERRLGLNREHIELDISQFRRPQPGQPDLFDDAL